MKDQQFKKQAMLQNYLKTALRNLLKNKLHALLNLSGLGIGLACCLLIAIYIAGEYRYDRQHQLGDRIWRVTRSFHDADGAENLHLSAIAPPFAGLLKAEFPEIESITRLLGNGTTAFRVGENNFSEPNVFFADSNFFQMFTVPVTSGDPTRGLSDPWQVVLSEKIARRWFGDRNPLGETVRADDQFNFKVAGVFRDYEPGTSHVYPEVLLSFPSLRDSVLYGQDRLLTDFSNNSFYTYLLVHQNFDPDKMLARFPGFLDKSFPPPPPSVSNPRPPSERTQLHLQRLTDIHLHSRHDDEIEPAGDYARVRLFGIVALVILLIAGINYVNLSSAFSLTRAREIGVRRSAGAARQQIIGQFLSESVLLSLAASLLAIALTAAALPFLKNMLDMDTLPSLSQLWQLPFLLFGAALLTGLLAGFYPAFFLSSFNTVSALKGSAQTGKENATLRKSLVIIQFGISIILLVGTAVISRQLSFLQKKELGLDKEQIVLIGNNQTLNGKWDAFRSELLRDAKVTAVCRSSRVPSGQLLDDLGSPTAQLGDSMIQTNVTLPCIATDLDFSGTYDIPLAAGRGFSHEHLTDTTHAWLLNESAVRAIGWKSPEEAIGKRLIYGNRQDCYVVGVLRDFHFESLRSPIVPMIFYVPRNRNNLFQISIKIGKDIPAALAQVEQTWKMFNPSYPFQYTFLDEQFGRLYASEIRQSRLFGIFSGLAVLIACLGLFGLATFMAAQRTKEIGVRKVLGASVAGITALLAKDFLKLVVVAIVIGSPLAYYFMQKWLSNFAYRIDIQWWMFVGAGAAAIAIAFLTVGGQAMKAALANPVQSLRSE